MVFLYIAAAVCLALCAAQLALCIRALHVFRKWRVFAMKRFAELGAVVGAIEKIAAQSTHDAEENGKKRDLIDEFFGVFNYGLNDALRAAQADRGTEDDSE